MRERAIRFGLGMTRNARWLAMIADVALVKVERRLVRSLAALPLFVLLATLASCATAHNAAQGTLSTMARSFAAADAEILGPGYKAAAATQLETATSLDDYHARMARWNRVEEGARVARSSLVAAQRALDADSAATSGSTMGAIACVVAALGEVYDALGAVGLSPPADLAQAIAGGRGLTGNVCENTTGGAP